MALSALTDNWASELHHRSPRAHQTSFVIADESQVDKIEQVQSVGTASASKRLRLNGHESLSSEISRREKLLLSNFFVSTAASSIEVSLDATVATMRQLNVVAGWQTPRARLRVLSCQSSSICTDFFAHPSALQLFISHTSLELRSGAYCSELIKNECRAETN